MKLPLTKKWMVTWKEKEENTVTYDLAAARLVKMSEHELISFQVQF